MKNIKLFGLLVFIAVVVIAVININMSASNIRGLSDISLANLEVENGSGYYKREIREDNGRVNVFKDNKYENCRQIVVTCEGEGTLFCLEHIEYDDCEPIFGE